MPDDISPHMCKVDDRKATPRSHIIRSSSSMISENHMFTEGFYSLGYSYYSIKP